MRSVINNKIYDTEKSEKIFSYLKNVQEPLVLFGGEYYRNCWRDVDMYKTKKENYFIHIKQPNEARNTSYYTTKEEFIEAITKEEAKSILQKLDIEKSIKEFGNIEEA